jgi:signal transduction histidine kinase
VPASPSTGRARFRRAANSRPAGAFPGPRTVQVGKRGPPRRGAQPAGGFRRTIGVTNPPHEIGPARFVARVAAVAALYFLGGRLGLWLAFGHGSVSPVWPPTGIALATLIVLGPRYWPGVAIGAFAVNVLTPAPLGAVLGITAGNTLEALAGAALLARLGPAGQAHFDRLEDVLALLFAAVAAPLVSAGAGMTSLCLAGAAPWDAFGPLALQWWIGDGMGALVLVPLVLAWRPGAPRGATGGPVEALVLLSGLVAAAALVFVHPFEARLLEGSYLVFPFVSWGALRFGLRGATAAIVVASGIAITGTVRGLGPFRGEDAAESLALLQVFLGVISVTGLMLAAIAAQRRAAEQALATVNAELEQRVLARTAELGKTNEELTKTNEENEAFVFSVSHDLRSPLVNLQGFSHELELTAADLRALLARDDVPADVRERALRLLDGDAAESIRFIRTGVSRLGSHTDALLRLSRAGRVEYRLGEVDVAAIAARVVASMHATIEERGATVRVGRLGSAWGDEIAVEQVLANLIGNALHYLDPSRPGEIDVADEDGAPAGMRTYAVRDNGRGIPAAHVADVFLPFRRFHPDAARGEGLGLAIVRRTVERHGGRVEVESSDGKGSTFRVTLPVAAHRAQPATDGAP